MSGELVPFEQVERMAAKLGASTDQVQMIGAIATLTGVKLSAIARQ